MNKNKEMKETRENLEKLYLLYNDENITFYNPNKNKKKKDYNKLVGENKKISKQNSLLFLGNIHPNHLYFSGKLCRIEKYNPKKIIKKEEFKINSLEQKNPILQIIQNKKNKSHSIKKRNNIYKIRKRIIDSEEPEYEKKNNTLLNILNRNNLYYNYKPVFQKTYNKRIKNKFYLKKSKNEEINNYKSVNDRNIYNFPFIKNHNI